MAKMRIQVKVSPWVDWYISAVMLMAHLTDSQPNMDKVEHWVSKGIRMVVVDS